MEAKSHNNFLMHKFLVFVVGLAIALQLYGALTFTVTDENDLAGIDKHSLEPPEHARNIINQRNVRQTRSAPTRLEPKHVIFYNIFVNKDRYEQTLEIIAEQMNGIFQSIYQNSTVYFNNWGKETRDSSICPQGIKCERIRYREKGGEEDTLQDLYEYCVDNPNDAVVYIHDKGSFNPTGSNKRVRNIATKSALSEACHSATSEQHGCSVCANRFQFLPNHHTPGNMWTANCSYVRLLIPPKDFDERRQAMFRHVRDNTTLHHKLYCVKALVKDFEYGHEFGDDQWKFMSIFRYAMEHWVFSHPFLRVCHTIPQQMSKVQVKSWTPTLIEGPGSSTLGFERATTTGWYQLDGRKFEYQYLYHALPRDDSFVWDVYGKAIVLPRDRIKC